MTDVFNTRSRATVSHMRGRSIIVHRIDYIVTASGAEALLLEASLIRQHQPPFNVLLKDDKRYCETCNEQVFHS